MSSPRVRFLAFLLTFLTAATAFAQSTGSVAGRVTTSTGNPAPGVIVTILEISRATVTDSNGLYSFSGVPAGQYTLNFAAGESAADETITVVAGERATRDRVIDWNLSLAETITVFSASRQTERIVEAPAAVTVFDEEDVEAISPSGQLPKVLESAPGVDFSQSGLYDINLNARGFNSSLNRRILTLIDGRDPAIAFLGAQEWAAISFPLDLISSVELVRGPGSALYGANAFNGVLNMTTKAPRYDQGGRVQLTGGDLSTLRADVSHAGGFGGPWFYRIVGGYQQSEDFTRSRTAATGVEYSRPCTTTINRDCLPVEAVPLHLDENEIMFGGIRLDRDWETAVFTIEGGYATLEGPTFQTGIGRVQVTDVERPWARTNYSRPHLNVLAYYDGRKAENQIALASGAPLFEDSSNARLELQTNWEFFQDRVRFVGGASVGKQEVDTSNNQGFHTLMAEAKETDTSALFAQFDVNPTDKLKLVVAGRWDDSDLHEAKVSPKASLVYSFTPTQSVRLTYNEAFQVPNYSEFFLRAPAGAPVNLSAIENAFAPFLGGVALNFGSVPVLALGNPALDVEEITSREIGYSAIFNNRVYFTADYYQNRVENFVTDLLPAVNPAFPAYQLPAGIAPQVAALIRGTLQQNLPPSVFASMTNINGMPAFVFSYTNAGVVDTQGVELAMNYYMTNNWILDANYAWFDFDVQEQQFGDELFPNAPEHKYNLGVTYRADRFDASVKYRWVDDFYWAAGIFKGQVDSYDVVNVSGNYKFTDNIALGATVSNLLDSNHYESFGGDLLARRALAFVSLGW